MSDYLNLDRVLILAFGFFLLFNAIDIADNLITQVLSDAHYG
jgi:hypothetical protein